MSKRRLYKKIILALMAVMIAISAQAFTSQEISSLKQKADDGDEMGAKISKNYLKTIQDRKRICVNQFIVFTLKKLLDFILNP